MRIAVLGADWIGGYYGALLAKAGQEVIFIARAGHLEAIRRRGLTLRTPVGERTTPVTAVADSHGPEIAVAQAEGAPLGPDAARAAVEQAATLPGSLRSSLARDLEDGRRLEVGVLSGAVVRRGRQHGVATLVHQTITACLSLHQPAQP